MGGNGIYGGDTGADIMIVVILLVVMVLCIGIEIKALVVLMVAIVEEFVEAGAMC